MAKVKSNAEVYAEIIAEIAARSAIQVDGVEQLGINPDKRRTIKENDVHAYLIDGNNVKIDIFINVLFGYNIPDTICLVQESIINAVAKETCYTVTEVNVTVVSVICNDDEAQPQIVHNFDDVENEEKTKE